MLLDVHLNVDFDVVPFSFERCLDLTNESFGDLVCGFTEDAGLEVLLGLILTTGKLVDSVLDGVHDASFHRRFHYTPCNLREIRECSEMVRVEVANAVIFTVFKNAQTYAIGDNTLVDLSSLESILASTTVRTQIGVIEESVFP